MVSPTIGCWGRHLPTWLASRPLSCTSSASLPRRTPESIPSHGGCRYAARMPQSGVAVCWSMLDSDAIVMAVGVTQRFLWSGITLY
jgi:hypothetical protein